MQKPKNALQEEIRNIYDKYVNFMIPIDFPTQKLYNNIDEMYHPHSYSAERTFIK